MKKTQYIILVIIVNIILLIIVENAQIKIIVYYVKMNTHLLMEIKQFASKKK